MLVENAGMTNRDEKRSMYSETPDSLQLALGSGAGIRVLSGYLDPLSCYGLRCELSKGRTRLKAILRSPVGTPATQNGFEKLSLKNLSREREKLWQNIEYFNKGNHAAAEAGRYKNGIHPSDRHG